MHFKHKLAYIALGGILVFVGQLLAIVSSTVTANVKAEFDVIRCQKLELIDPTGTVRGKLWIENEWGKADFPLMTCKNLRVVKNWSEPPTPGNLIVHLGYLFNDSQTAIRVMNPNARWNDPSSPTGVPFTDPVVQLGTNERGGYFELYGNSNNPERHPLAKIENFIGGGRVALYDQNGFLRLTMGVTNDQRGRILILNDKIFTPALLEVEPHK